MPQGPVIPPGNLVPAFAVTPTAPTDGQTVLFDASVQHGIDLGVPVDLRRRRPVVGRTASYAYSRPGTYVVTLTLVDFYGRTASRSQSITVDGRQTSPQPCSSSRRPRHELARASTSTRPQSRPPAGGTLVTYTWNFGDGSPVRVTGDAATSKAYATAGTYQVTLTVTDNAGRTTTSHRKR